MARITKNKVQFFQEKILQWYATHNRAYAWRKAGLTPYEYIIAEVLLQRTRADTVAKFFNKFLADYPNWQSLAVEKRSSVEKYLMPIGLYRQRAKGLQNLANEMVLRGSTLPEDRSELEQIPLFGQYITNAVEMVVFNRPRPLIDVNMARVLERFFGPRKLADIRHDHYLQSLASKIVDHDQYKAINWGILDFAALVCKARNPLHEMCPLKEYCTFCKKSLS